MDPNNTHLEQFLQSVMAERASGSLFWVHMLHKLILASAGLFFMLIPMQPLSVVKRKLKFVSNTQGFQ